MEMDYENYDNLTRFPTELFDGEDNRWKHLEFVYALLFHALDHMNITIINQSISDDFLRKFIYNFITFDAREREIL